MREEGRGRALSCSQKWKSWAVWIRKGLIHYSSLDRNFFSRNLLIFLNRYSSSSLNTCRLSERDDLTFSSFRFATLILTFIPAPSIQARTARRPTPTSEIEAGLPLAAISPRRS